MDIVYTLKNTKKSPELNYSLRSLKNIKHDNVYIVGGIPDNIDKQEVKYVYSEQFSNNKFINIINNIYNIIMSDELSDDFVLMNDDFFFINTIKNPVKELNLFYKLAEDVYKKFCELGRGESIYTKGLDYNIRLLKKLGIQKPLYYDLHIPFIYNKLKLRELFERIPDIKYCGCSHTRTLYGNLYYKDSKQLVKDVKIFENSDFKIEKGQKFLSCSDKGFRKIEPYLKSLFPNRSKYELY